MSEHEKNPRSIKYHVRKYLLKNKNRIQGKQVIDFPAGNGITTALLMELGAKVQAFDLFPEYFELSQTECKRANIREGLPLPDESADILICQEGIEHFTDQYQALRTFNRVLKPGGRLIITTPNYSNIRARLSYLLSESERFATLMPPNEIDSVWMADHSKGEEFYFGHVFLIGIQKLRVLARLSGFKIKHIQFVRLKTTSLLFFPILYPFIFLASFYAWRKHSGKKGLSPEAKAIYLEQFKLNIHPGILLDGHLFVEFEKTESLDAVQEKLKSVHTSFGET